MGRTVQIDIDLARQMRASDPPASWNTVASALGVSPLTVRRKLDPGFATRERRDRPSSARSIAEIGNATSNITKAEIIERLSAIPSDTRTWQQRFMGDPLPGRSALAKR